MLQRNFIILTRACKTISYNITKKSVVWPTMPGSVQDDPRGEKGERGEDSGEFPEEKNGEGGRRKGRGSLPLGVETLEISFTDDELTLSLRTDEFQYAAFTPL